MKKDKLSAKNGQSFEGQVDYLDDLYTNMFEQAIQVQSEMLNLINELDDVLLDFEYLYYTTNNPTYASELSNLINDILGISSYPLQPGSPPTGDIVVIAYDWINQGTINPYEAFVEQEFTADQYEEYIMDRIQNGLSIIQTIENTLDQLDQILEDPDLLPPYDDVNLSDEVENPNPIEPGAYFTGSTPNLELMMQEFGLAIFQEGYNQTLDNCTQYISDVSEYLQFMQNADEELYFGFTLLIEKNASIVRQILGIPIQQPGPDSTVLGCINEFPVQSNNILQRIVFNFKKNIDELELYVDALSESQLQYLFYIIESNQNIPAHIVTNNNYNYMYALGMNGVNQYAQEMNGSFDFGFNVMEYFQAQFEVFNVILQYVKGNYNPNADVTPTSTIPDLVNQETKNIMGEYLERIFKLFYDKNIVSLFDDFFGITLPSTFAEFLCTDYFFTYFFDDLNYMPSVCIGQPIGTYNPTNPGNQGQSPNGDSEFTEVPSVDPDQVPPLPPDLADPPPLPPVQPPLPPVQPPVSPGGNIRILKGLIDLDAKKGKFIYE